MNVFKSSKQFLIKFNDIEHISKQLTALIRLIKEKYFVKFFKSSEQSVIKCNDIQDFSKQLTALITR